MHAPTTGLQWPLISFDTRLSNHVAVVVAIIAVGVDVDPHHSTKSRPLTLPFPFKLFTGTFKLKAGAHAEFAVLYIELEDLQPRRTAASLVVVVRGSQPSSRMPWLFAATPSLHASITSPSSLLRRLRAGTGAAVATDSPVLCGSSFLTLR